MAEKNDPTVVSEWIEAIWESGGTDLLFTVGAPPLGRIDGDYRPFEDESVLGEGDTEKIVQRMLTTELQHQLHDGHQVDFSLTWQNNVRVRGNAFMQRGQYAIALRIIPLVIPTLDALGLPPVVKMFAEAPSGLVLITGPTGAGKSTTIASLVDHVNATRPCHILTIEEPIEYVHAHKQSVVSQREVGVDAYSFGDALRAALREDPDVILVGEMRDLDSIATTLTLAETGHLVFATLHTNDTAQALDRIIDVFPADRRDQIQVQLSSTLQGVIYQRLVPRIGGGLVGAYEIMIGNNAVKNLVREGKTRQLRNVVATHQSEGMQTLEASLSALVLSGAVSHEQAVAVSLYQREIASVPVVSQEAPKTRGRRRS